LALRDLFSSAGRDKSRLDKLIRTIENKYTQSGDRYAAMERLLALGQESVPALIGLMRRFTVAASKSIEDEEEKGWLFRQLTALPPEKVLPAAREFLLHQESIAWVLRLVEDVADPAQEWAILEAVLAKHPPVYERDPSTKLDLLTRLQELSDPRIPAIIAQYLDDPDEGVRYGAVEALIKLADPATMPALLARLVHPDEDSIRLRSRILAGFAALAWDLSEHRVALAPHLGHEFSFDGKHVHAR
jgi:HEAT repeat protein